MAKPLSFKDFLTVDYTPGMPDQVSYNAMKRKRGRIGEESDLEEKELTFQQRRARARVMKRIAPKLRIGREKAKRRTAGTDKLAKRSQKQVRMDLFRKFSKGKSRGEVPMARRKEIEKRINKLPPSRIAALVKKKLPSVRKQERERKRTQNASR